MGKLLALLILATCFLPEATAQRRMSVGLSGNYGSYNRFGGEIYVRKPISLIRKDAEFKAGIVTRNYPLSFDGVENLEATSLGIFGDAAIYPFPDNGLFTGIRLEVLDFNWLATSSSAEIERQREYDMPPFFLGASAFFQAGYCFAVSEGFALRLYGQPGVRYFLVTNGSTSINGSDGLQRSQVNNPKR
ncbi:hypothetical protein [Parapedobacter tibetensis]|uniref:hypothetical protein n=1 Tax=Parapedobacter tibetensis TaxID=2972951 RepID=UPI00214D1D25|nr:hypothetical protein [Parapedobacter tibetensis]